MYFAQVGIAEDVCRQLDCVLANGCYKFVLKSISDVIQCHLELKFWLTPEPQENRATGTIISLEPESDLSAHVKEGSFLLLLMILKILNFSNKKVDT